RSTRAADGAIRRPVIVNSMQADHRWPTAVAAGIAARWGLPSHRECSLPIHGAGSVAEVSGSARTSFSSCQPFSWEGRMHAVPLALLARLTLLLASDTISQ